MQIKDTTKQTGGFVAILLKTKRNTRRINYM